MQRILKNIWEYVSVLVILTLAIVACNNNDSVTIFIGSGPGFLSPFGITVEADGSLVVVDFGLDAVVRVDQVSGDRTIISDASIGSGPDFVAPVGIAVEDDGSLVVIDIELGAVVRVDQVSGDSTMKKWPCGKIHFLMIQTNL